MRVVDLKRLLSDAGRWYLSFLQCPGNFLSVNSLVERLTSLQRQTAHFTEQVMQNSVSNRHTILPQPVKDILIIYQDLLKGMKAQGGKTTTYSRKSISPIRFMCK